MKRPNSVREKGFTLIEILVSILIFSIVVFLLFTSLNAFTESNQYARDNFSRKKAISQAFKIIHADLESLCVSQEPIPGNARHQNLEDDPLKFHGNKEFISAELEASFFNFATYTQIQYHQNVLGGVSLVGYYLKKKDDDDSFNLYRSDRFRLSLSESRNCADPVLIKDIQGFDVQYTDHEGNYFDNWDSSQAEFDYQYPTGITISIQYGTDDNVTRFQTSRLLKINRRSSDPNLKK